MSRSLDSIEKATILEALVDARYEVRRAAGALRISPQTIYRRLWRWDLASPQRPRAGHGVMRKEFVERCGAIDGALQEVKEMNKRKEAPNSYVQDRDSTAGRNNDNPQLKELDRKYGSDKAREGTNADRDSFSREGRC